MKNRTDELSEVLVALGQAVRLYRSKLNISQEELAHRAELHRTYIADIERGARNVTLLTLVRLASALEVSVEVLMRELPAENKSRSDL